MTRADIGSSVLVMGAGRSTLRLCADDYAGGKNFADERRSVRNGRRLESTPWSTPARSGESLAMSPQVEGYHCTASERSAKNHSKFRRP